MKKLILERILPFLICFGLISSASLALAKTDINTRPVENRWIDLLEPGGQNFQAVNPGSENKPSLDGGILEVRIRSPQSIADAIIVIVYQSNTLIDPSANMATDALLGTTSVTPKGLVAAHSPANNPEIDVGSSSNHWNGPNFKIRDGPPNFSQAQNCARCHHLDIAAYRNLGNIASS